jgi:hypothetical protein
MPAAADSQPLPEEAMRGLINLTWDAQNPQHPDSVALLLRRLWQGSFVGL